MIGLRTNLTSPIEESFRLYGTQSAGNAIMDFDTYQDGDGWIHYTIPAGEYFTGTYDYLVFVSDDDSATLRKHTQFDSFGNVTNEQHYDSNGTPVADTHAEAIDQLFAYTGRALDESTGLQNNLHRWYDAAIGQWASEDPIGFAALDPNLRRYVGNVATSHTDPEGLEDTYGPEDELLDRIFSRGESTTARQGLMLDNRDVRRGLVTSSRES